MQAQHVAVGPDGGAVAFTQDVAEDCDAHHVRSNRVALVGRVVAAPVQKGPPLGFWPGIARVPCAHAGGQVGQGLVRTEGDGGVVRKQGGGGELCERGEIASVPVLMHIHDGWE